MKQLNHSQTTAIALDGRGISPQMVVVLLAIVAYVVVGCWTIPDYGVGLDYAEYFLGDRFFYFWTSLDWRYLDFTTRQLDVYQNPGHPDYFQYGWVRHRPYQVWPIGVTAGALSKFVLFSVFGALDPIDATHMVGPLFAGTTLLILFLFVRVHIGAFAAMVAVACTAVHPRFWSHLHYNLKDIPSCMAWVGVVVVFYEAVVRRQARLMAAAAVLWGVALATKANALFLSVVCAPTFVYHWWLQRSEPAFTRQYVVATCTFPLVGIVTMILVWPYMFIAIPDNLHMHVAYLLARGRQSTSGWDIWPLVHAVCTTPLPILVLFVVGFGERIGRIIRERQLATLDLLLILWLVVPVARVSMPSATDFDGIRHWLEFIPAVAIFAGIGASTLVRLIMRVTGDRSRLADVWAMTGWLPCAVGVGLTCLWLMPTIRWNVRNHPYQVVFFNRIIGGLAGAQERNVPEATDYWCVSYRQGLKWLNENADDGDMLVVGVGQNSVHLTRGIWQQRRLVNLRLLTNRDGSQAQADVRPAIEAHNGSVYLMYVTRRAHYSDLVEQYDRSIPPVFEVSVDGGSVLRILRLKQG